MLAWSTFVNHQHLFNNVNYCFVNFLWIFLLTFQYAISPVVHDCLMTCNLILSSFEHTLKLCKWPKEDQNQQHLLVHIKTKISRCHVSCTIGSGLELPWECRSGGNRLCLCLGVQQVMWPRDLMVTGVHYAWGQQVCLWLESNRCMHRCVVICSGNEPVADFDTWGVKIWNSHALWEVILG